LHAHRRALELLRAGTLAPAVDRLSPRVLGHGHSGLAEWLLEERLAGSAMDGPPEGTVLQDCLDFLVDLHAAGSATHRPTALVGAATVIAQFGGPSTSAALESLARDVDSELEGSPRGFGHGDFFYGNLLVGGGRLLGVIDWTSAGPRRLPLLDWLHLRLLVKRGRGSQGWGPAILSQLLPWAERGGDALTDQYCARIGLNHHGPLLRAFVVAYWLDRLSQQLASYGGDRMQRPVWLRNNLHRVLAAFTESARA
jgi:aminoglycoside phosphotransferase (APT) family kinase protein